MAEIQGSYDDLFTAVPSVLAALLDAGDVGASVAVFVDGEPVVDVWGGFADADRTIPWQRDTIANVWSVTKTMTALCALILADRGELDLSAPVAGPLGADFHIGLSAEYDHRPGSPRSLASCVRRYILALLIKAAVNTATAHHSSSLRRG